MTKQNQVKLMRMRQTKQTYIIKSSGGVMEKKKFQMMVLLCLGLAGLVQAVEVISIDINNYGNDTAYAGEAAVPGATEWVSYYGGWGVAVGSPKTADLINIYEDPFNPVTVTEPYEHPGTYAEQVWLGDPGAHGQITGAGDGLLDDGFVKNTVADPNLRFIGADSFFDIAGQNHPYSGTYDIYVYGNSAGTFYLKDVNDIELASASVTGTTTGFVEGENYVVFEDVSIAQPESVLLYYTNELNGIQLVRDTGPFVVIASTDPNENVIDSTDYDVAYETNSREDEIDVINEYNIGTLYGPDVWPGNVGILDTNEYMEYDLVVDSANEGQYNLTINIANSATIQVFLDGSLKSTISSTDTIPVNLFAGSHVLKWQSTGWHGGNIGNIVLTYLGEITLDDCDDVYAYELNLAGDLNHDCRVNMDDLVLVVEEWAANYNQ